jgi:nucleoside-diphosphate-sugar epimerase
MDQQKRVLVTGSGGYIGAVLLPQLAASGFKTVGLDTQYFDGCDFSSDLSDRFSTKKKDIRDVTPDDLQGCFAVIHLAALSNDPLGHVNEETTLSINYHASVRLAKAASAAGVERFLFSSSCSMYGTGGEDEALAEDAPLRPVTPYAVSKVRSEEEILGLASSHFAPVFLRNATAYGVSPRLRTDIVLNNLVGSAYLTGNVLLMSDGTAWRPLVHVDDICRTFIRMLQAPRELVDSQAFNVGSTSENYQVRQLADIVASVVPDSKVTVQKGATSDKRNYNVDFTKLVRTFGPDLIQWDVRRGAQQLYSAYDDANLTSGQLEDSFVRLRRIEQLLSDGALDHDFRWTARPS